MGIPIAVVALMTAFWASGCFGGGSDSDTSTTGKGQGRTISKVIALQGGKKSLQVLLVRNSARAYLSPGAWFFPTGLAQPGAADDAIGAAGVNALQEQASLRVDAGDLVPYAEWIAPGFDTHFYLAEAPANSVPRPGGSQVVDVGWYKPQQALAKQEAGKLQIDYSTMKQLESLAAFPDADAALNAARGRQVTPINLRVVGQGANRHVVLPSKSP
jgi:8-oxo-dGTP pyrophosphatase MutT (NUDIX family)